MSTTIQPAPMAPTDPASRRSRIRDFYQKHEKHTGIAIFGLGFIWDSLTMTRVDNMIDNIILLFYLTVIAAIIIITIRKQCGNAPAGWLRKIEPRFLWVMQFCFGGLFSSYVIFYFKSASFTRTQFFFLILVLLWVGNEFLEERLGNQALLSVLYCFCLFSFFAFFLPVILAKVSLWIFLLAGVLSVIISLGVFSFAFLPDPEQWRPRMIRTGAWILSVYLAINLLYFANLIPPVPLALKSAAIYHQVTHSGDGYTVKYVEPSIFRFWRKWDNPFYYSKGERVYCYTAIFAPNKINGIPIYHVWSKKTSKGWVRVDSIPYELKRGGREGGYRGETHKSGVAPGEWRVEVETESGQTLGRIDFTIVPSPDPHPALVTEVIR